MGERPRECRGRLGRRQGERRAQLAPAEPHFPKGANSVLDGGQAAAITEPHPRLSDCQPAGFQNARPQRAALKRIGRKPSPGAKLARFESPAKGFNGIITKL
jgi:hypothetical protein